MVRAILDGRKTCTRRAVKANGAKIVEIERRDLSPFSVYTSVAKKNELSGEWIRKPYQPGDILYVPEAWKCSGTFGELGYEVEFRDGQHIKFRFEDRDRAKKWAKYRDKPSHQWQSPYFMPREAARIFLRVTDVRAERLQDMTVEDAAIDFGLCPEEIQTLGMDLLCKGIWNSTIPKDKLPIHGWKANPWVWVIEFERISKEEAKE